MPQNIIVDSSVVVKWINTLDEQNLEQANKLIDDMRAEKVSLLAPELAKYEVANALLFGKKLTIPESKTSLPSFYNLPINFFPMTLSLSESAYEIAKYNEITFYDPSFVALAKQENATLITDNPKHQAKIKDVKVIALKDYK